MITHWVKIEIEIEIEMKYTQFKVTVQLANVVWARSWKMEQIYLLCSFVDTWKC
jgi:hypothetical protein